MTEITHVTLENEMDLILAHKQSMRLAELTGLSISAQTTFATAVSEVSRSAISREQSALLKLYVADKRDKVKFITAVIEDKRKNFDAQKDEGYIYAKRLVSNINTETGTGGTKTELHYRLAPTLRIDDMLVEKWQINLNTDPTISPYEEIKRKNRQLVELADKLRDSEAQYKSLTDSLPIMIFSTTVDGLITYSNQWLSDYTGESIDEINGSKWEAVMHPDDYERVWAHWNGHAQDPGSTIAPELRIKSKTRGEYRWHAGVSIPIINEDESIKWWNTFLVDVHDQKIIEETLRDNDQLKEIKVELEEKIKQLNQSNEQLEQFAYVASHDLQEPLRKISFYSDFLKNKYEPILPDEAKLFFGNLINASDRMKSLIKDILAYSTVWKEGFTRVDLNKVASGTIQDLEIGIKEKQARINVEDLPEIDGNERQLSQLFENLISNSLKFSKGENVLITIRSEVIDNEVRLSFEDNGIGFDEKYVPKMFDLFQRLHTADKYKGTGIGLAMCKKIVELHNGKIEAQSEPGNGATFLITLPARQN